MCTYDKALAGILVVWQLGWLKWTLLVEMLQHSPCSIVQYYEFMEKDGGGIFGWKQ